jgi:hypothetical protein
MGNVRSGPSILFHCCFHYQEDATASVDNLDGLDIGVAVGCHDQDVARFRHERVDHRPGMNPMRTSPGLCLGLLLSKFAIYVVL